MKIEQWYKGRLVPPPVYEYKPYPRWITKADGTQLIVENEEEEKMHLAEAEKPAEKPKRGRPKNDATTANDSLGHNQPSAENS
jgi:hypothetical protein